MAQKIKIGYKKQLYTEDGMAVRHNGQEVYQCDDPNMWKNGSGQYISDLKGKSFFEVANKLGYKSWFSTIKKLRKLRSFFNSPKIFFPSQFFLFLKIFQIRDFMFEFVRGRKNNFIFS